MTMLAHVAERVLGRPLLITPEKAEVILSVLSERIGIDSPLPPLDASRFVGARHEKGQFRVEKGIAIIPVIGTLVNRGAYLGAQSGLTSYEGLTQQLKEARKDGQVRGILLDMDTPGGEAGGAFEVPELIREIRRQKPVFAMVNDMAASAGYAIASAANQIWMTRTGIVGSIGVVMVHFDRSGELKKAGIQPTIIHAGAKKADGNSFGPLPADVRERLQAEIDGVREMFIASVIAGRPQLKAAKIKETEAGIYMGEAAIEIGLADGIATFDRVLEVMSSQLGRLIEVPAGAPTKTETRMTDTTVQAAAPGIDKAALDAATGKARADGETAGKAAERQRIAAIIQSDEAKGRADMAVAMALDTDMTAEEARKVLARAPKEQSAPTAAAQPSTAAQLYAAVARTGGMPQVPSAGADGNAVPDRARANIERQTQRLANRR